MWFKALMVCNCFVVAIELYGCYCNQDQQCIQYQVLLPAECSDDTTAGTGQGRGCKQKVNDVYCKADEQEQGGIASFKPCWLNYQTNGSQQLCYRYCPCEKSCRRFRKEYTQLSGEVLMIPYFTAAAVGEYQH